MFRHDTLDVSDIQGAQSRRPASRTRTSHPFIHTFDIEQTAPQPRGLNTSRCTNALSPNYNLPSYELAPEPEYRSAPRDTMWTLPQNNRKFSTRDIMNRSDVEARSKALLLRDSMTTRDIMASNDITGPQFRIEAPSMRRTNPLSPSYVYDGGEVDQVVTHVPKHGRQYPRTPETAFSLMTKDINTAAVHKTEYPKHLIKTRQANRTDDIEGARASTIGVGPKFWTTSGKDPSKVPEKTTNRIWDIDGTIPGTGGCSAFEPPKMYRDAKQMDAVKRAMAPKPAARSQPRAERQADIAAVQALK